MKKIKRDKDKVIHFDDVEDLILQELKERSEQFFMEDNVTLLKGFFNLQSSSKMVSSIVIGGPFTPLVMLLGDSGQMYFIALKALLKDLDE